MGYQGPNKVHVYKTVHHSIDPFLGMAKYFEE